MRIDVFTIFPDMVEQFADRSLVGKARAAGALDIRVHDLRAGATDPHRSVDDSPFGGGAGMVLMPEPVFAAVEAIGPPRPLYYLGPAGRRGLGQTVHFDRLGTSRDIILRVLPQVHLAQVDPRARTQHDAGVLLGWLIARERSAPVPTGRSA